ncbi:MAG: aspartate aminotransferase family protein [Actinomycetota bacterium]
MTHVFRRVRDRELPVAARAHGAWIEDAEGRRYLDAAGGAIVVNVGHGDPDLVAAMAAQAGAVDYVHGTTFTTAALEGYADDLAPVLPMDDGHIYPVSGGSEAVETALKMARAYHLARGDVGRDVVIARRGSYHGNTVGALDASGKEPLRSPYAPWLGRVHHVGTPYEYRCDLPGHPTGCGTALAAELEATIVRLGPDRVAAFIAEPVTGATLAAAVPPADYWPAIAEVCRRHGVLLIADEVMTGFGRTGRWFGVDHWGVRPDLLTCAKGSTSGVFPFGFAAASGAVVEAIGPAGFVHGFTWSHNGVGAAVAHAARRRLRDGRLVEAAAEGGAALLEDLRERLAGEPGVGDVRGLGMLLGIELVRDRATKAPYPRAERVTERVLAAGRERGILLYSSTGHVDGDGDLLVLGPPLGLTTEERGLVVERTADAIDAVCR